MSEVGTSCELNPLIIIEDEVPSTKACDNNDDNESIGELFDFSDSDINEVDEDVSCKPTIKRNSLLIVEEKDLIMDEAEDFNNNMHRLSLQVESGDDNSLVMTNEAINTTIIKIGSNNSSVEFGEADDNVIDTPHEAINHEIGEIHRRSSENFTDDGEAIVDILGQIDDIVGSIAECKCFLSNSVEISGNNWWRCLHFCYRL